MYARISAYLVACALVFTGLASAQERFGALTGRVTDQQGQAIPGVTVVATNTQTGAVRSFVTDGNGQFAAQDLVPGRYNVRFELTGFAKIERDNINVLLGRSFQLDTQMRVGELTETVQVSAEATPLVDTRSTLIAHNVTAEEFDRMPKGRSFQSVAMTAPSVNQGEIEGGIQVNGASGSENQFTVDGVATNSLLNGQSRQNTVFEYLQEVQVKTVGIPAEFGGALGGVISAVTKSGGNTFRGEGHYYYSGSGLSAGPVKRFVLSPVDDRTVGYFQDAEQPDNRNEIGGSLGGPIVRDRLFFFGSISPRFRSQTNEYQFSSGATTGEISRDQTIMNAYGKVSFASRRFNAYFGALWTPTNSDGTLPAYNASGANFISSSITANETNKTRGFETDQRNLTGNVDINLSNSTFLSVKGGYFYDDYKDTGVSTTTPIAYQNPSSASPLPVPANLQGAAGVFNTPAVQITEFDTTKQAYVQADFNAAFSAAGFHTLKVGTGLRHNTNDVDQRYPGGRVTVFWDSVFTSSVPGVPPGRGAYGYYAVDDLGTFGATSANISHVYAQDQWTMGNLTLNLGVRLENEHIPSFLPEVQKDVINFGFGDKIAPRIGAAYDLFGDGRVKAFGSYGRYYDWTKYELSRGSFGGDIWQVYYRSLDDPNVIPQINLSNLPGRDLFGSATGFQDFRIPAFDTIDPNIKPMSQDSYSAGVDFQLGRSSVFTVNYIHNELVRTIEDIGLVVDGSEVYLYANPGEGLATDALISTQTAPFTIPKAKRQYDALQLSVNRRFADNWFLGSSYVYSRLYGNYAGIANSDEIRTPATATGYGFDQQQSLGVARPGGNANRSWDLDEMMWDARGNLDVRGRLATDRPNVFKLYGAYLFPFGTQVGANFYAASGTPLTTVVNTISPTQIFVEGRGDMGRTPMLNYTDVLLSHEFPVGGSTNRLRLELNVLNVFNQKTATHVYSELNRNRSTARINLASTNLANGYDYRAMITARPDAAGPFDPRYGQEDLFREGTSAHFLVKWTF
jgi:Carboxypeptidase regulatory-like domain